MTNEAIDKFLLGIADDDEQRRCEELLSNPETIVDCQSTVAGDSLLDALRLSTTTTPDLTRIEQLAEKMAQLVPRQAISASELQRLLDPPVQPNDIGLIGRYRVIEFLASGGMGLVFRAIDPELDRPVLEVGQQRELPFLVMPMLDGMSLRTWHEAGTVVVRGTTRSFAPERMRHSVGVFNWNKPGSEPENAIYTLTVQGRFDMPQWHETANVAVWELNEKLNFFDADSGGQKSIIAMDATGASTKFGWLISTENRLVALEPNGASLGQLTFDPLLVDGKPSNPRWILKDGSMQAHASREGLYMVYWRNNRVFCDPLTEFISNPVNPKLPEALDVFGLLHKIQ